MKVRNISKEELNKFSLNHKYGTYYQTSQYGDLMETIGYKSEYVGIYDKEELVGASLFITKRITGGFKYSYAPRGFLFDYTNHTNLKRAARALKHFFNKNRIIMLKIDPPIGNKEIATNLEDCHFKHYGYNENFKTLKPRWNMVINLEGLDNTTLFNKFDKNVRTKIRTADKKGIIIFRGNKDYVHVIYSFLKKQRENGMKYYEDLYSIFSKNNMIDIYLSKIDSHKYLKHSRDAFYKEKAINEELEEKIMRNINNNKEFIELKIKSDVALAEYKKELETSTQYVQRYPDGIVIGGAIVIKYKNNIFFSIDGLNESYKSFYPNHLMKWAIISEYLQKGYKYVDLNGITGNFDRNSELYGLYEFKKGFNSKPIEYIGEFTLITNKIYHFIYKMILKFLNMFRLDKKLEY